MPKDFLFSATEALLIAVFLLFGTWAVSTNVVMVLGWPAICTFGFWIPFFEYLVEVAHSLSPGGVVITDVRNGYGGEEEMRLMLGDVRVLKEDRKSNLIIACSIQN